MTTPESPEYDLNIEERDGIVHARVHAVKITADVAASLLPEVRAAVATARTGWLIFEYELAHRMTDEEMFDFLEKFVETFSGLRAAFVTTDPRHLPTQRFGVAIGVDAGQDLASFTDPSQARRWLMEG